MLNQPTFKAVEEIAGHVKQTSNVMQYRSLRTMEELGNLVRTYRTSSGKATAKFHAASELFICSLVNVLCVSTDVELESLNSRLNEASSTRVNWSADSKMEEEEGLLTSMAARSGCLAMAIAGGLEKSEFAYHAFHLLDDSYRLLKTLGEDPEDVYFNTQIQSIFEIWSAKRKLNQLQNQLWI